MIDIKVKRTHPHAQLPRYAHTGAFGDLAADLYSVEEVRLEKDGKAAIATGIVLQFPEDHGAMIEDRSGLALAGITTLAGVIDPGYRGEIKVVLLNVSGHARTIQKGDRIAQMRIVRRIEATFTEVADIDTTVRAAAGFGSTGA